MAIKKVNVAKVTAWTETVRADFEGPITGVAIELFCMLTHAQREKAIERMQRFHAEHPAKTAETANVG
jgi:hypothetical protein